jgi:hypothetical protein
MGRILRRFSIVAFLALLPLNVVAQQAGTDAPCPRPPAGSLVRPPPHLFSHNGLLDVAFDYLTAVDDELSPNFGDGLKIRRRLGLEARQNCR